MPDKSFAQLVGDAPEAADAGTVSLVGILGRSKDSKRFVLTLADGRAVTLEMDAVVDHQVLSGAAGQTVVRVGLDASRVPQGAIPISPLYLYSPGSNYTGAADVTSAPSNPTPPKSPFADAHFTGFLDMTLAWLDVPGVQPPAPVLSSNFQYPPPFSLAVPQAFQGMMAPFTGWGHPGHRPKVLSDGSYPYGPIPDY